MELQFLEGNVNGFDEPMATVEISNGKILEVIIDSQTDKFSMTIYEKDGTPTREYYSSDDLEELLKPMIEE